MNFQSLKKIIIFLLVLLSTMFSCTLLEKEKKKTIKFEYYAIEPNSILTALSNGGNNVFSPMIDQPDYASPPPGSMVNWKQSDYFYIIDAFYKDVLGDTLEGWSLNMMDFSLGCNQTEHGFQDGRFEFFKVVKDRRERETRITRFIEIDTRYKFVTIRETEYYPNLMNWSFIDLENIKITGEGALQIAEKNGGEEKRLSAPSTCYIDVGLSPDSVAFTGWLVSYSLADSPTYFFSIMINPTTGEIIKP